MRVGRLCAAFGLSGLVAVGCGEDGATNPGGSTGGHAGADDASGNGGKTGGSSGKGTTGGSSGRGGKGGATGDAGSSANAGNPGEAGQTSDAGSGGSGARGGSNGAAGSPTIVASLLPSFKSGSRLKVRQYRSGDMPPVFLSFYDAELESDCEFSDAGTGELYCLPKTQLAPPSAAGSLFADEDCSEPIAAAELDCVSAGDSYVYESQVESCVLVNRPFRAVDLGENPTLYVDNGGGCVEQAVVGGTTRYYRVEPADLSDFVKGELEVVESPTGLSVKRVVGADGSYQTLRVVDVESGHDCRIFDFDGDARCVPLPVFSGETYRAKDPDCSEPLSLRYCGPGAPDYVVDTAGDTYQVWEAGPEYTGPLYSLMSTCEEVTDEGPYYELGEAVEPSRFVGSTSTFLGSGRLQHNVLIDSGGTALVSGGVSGMDTLSISGLYDSELGQPCSLYRDEGRTTYCLPDGVPTELDNSLAYADADCTLPLQSCPTSGCPVDLGLVRSDSTAFECGFFADFTHVRALGDEYTGSEYFIYSTAISECEGPYEVGAATFRVVTGEGSLDAFVTLEDVVE